MKKAASIFAVLVMSIGLFSCEAESNLDETDALYDVHVDASMDDKSRPDGGGRE